MGTAGREYVASQFEIEHVLDLWEGIYEELDACQPLNFGTRRQSLHVTGVRMNYEGDSGLATRLAGTGQSSGNE